jgi:S1-C subfamily serine protease
MNPIDAAILVLLVLGIVAGVRAGFFGPALGLVGGAIGFGVALALATALRDQLAPIEQPLRAIVTFLALVAFVLVGEAAGSAAGARLSHGVRSAGLRPLEAVGGAAVGAAHVVLLVWLVAGMLAAGLAPGLAGVASESVALRSVAERFPPPSVVAGRLLTLLDMTDLPPLFAGLEPEPAPPVGPPVAADVQALADSAIGSTARIAATGCGSGIAVGSGFFVSPTDVVTNAHVVAGGAETTVTLGSTVHVATVVAFDPEADLALLHVQSAQARPMALSPEPPQRGTSAAAIGYPGGGALTVAPAAVTATYDVGGPDIYGGGISERSVVEMRVQVRPGNSGGPLVVAPGVVGGVVFGASRTNPDVGYAIGADQAMASIGPFIGSTAPVGTGACL